MERDRAEVRQVDERVDIVDEEHDFFTLVGIARVAQLRATQPIRRALRDVPLVKALAANAVRVAHHHDRTIGEERQHRGGNRRVELDQIALGVALVGPEDFVAVRDVDARLGGRAGSLREPLRAVRGGRRAVGVGRARGARLGRAQLLVGRHRTTGGGLDVVADAAEDGVAQVRIRREALETHTHHDFRLDPVGVLGLGGNTPNTRKHRRRERGEAR